LTNGHLDILARARRLADRLIVAILEQDQKTPLFSVEERIDEMIAGKRKMAAEILSGGGEVDLTGLSDAELIECYQQCDLFVLPNRTVEGDFEGFGMVLVEAQACGQPVIAGDSGGTRETMIVGETGLIVDCTRPEPLAEAVGELLVDKGRRARMGQAAREHALAQFDWPQLAARAAGILGLHGEAPAMPAIAIAQEPAEAVVA
jgi:cytidyltransferase-like protein